jgi:hypothetical protein
MIVVSGAASALGACVSERQIIVKFSHLHDAEHAHDDNHVHHGEQNHNNANHQADNDANDLSAHDEQNESVNQESDKNHESRHTHEIAVSCSHIMFTPTTLSVSNSQFDLLQFPVPGDSVAPRSRILESLFRPPIQA